MLNLVRLVGVMAIAQAQVTVLRDVTVIDGAGGAPRQHTSVIIEGTKIRAIAAAGAAVPSGATVIDLAGKTLMPEIINAHGHLGLLKGTKMSDQNYTAENVRRQLLQYQDYGVGAVLVMGTDRDEAYQWRTDSHQGICRARFCSPPDEGSEYPMGFLPRPRA